jgi:hypothetical protein
MPTIGISITKRCTFRDSLQEFSNVYHYNVAALPSQATAEGFITELVNIEKGFHATHTTFVRGRLWSAGGTNAQNNMIAQVTLSGTGSLSPIANMDRERAFLVRWPAGSDSRGKPVFLRKYYHSGAAVGTATPGATQLEQTAGFTQAQRDSYAGIMNNVRVLSAGQLNLVAESGRQTQGPAEGHKYLEHHQFGDQWRAQ